MTKHKSQIRGAGSLFIAAFIYATFAVLARLVADMWSDDGQVVSRLLIAFIIAVIIVYLRKRTKLSNRHIWLSAALGICFGFIMLLYTFSVQKTTIANCIFLLYAGSIISSFIIGTTVLKEKVTTIKLLAIALALCGIGVYAHAILVASAGIVTGILAGLLDGVANSIRKPMAGIDRYAAMRIQYAAAALVGLIATLFSHEAVIKQVTLPGTVGIVVWGALLVCLGNLLLFGFQHFDVNVGTVILASELVFAVLLGWIFYNEVPAPHELLGGMLIFTAAVISALPLRRPGPKISQPV